MKLNKSFNNCYGKGCTHIPKGSCVTCKKVFELQAEDKRNEIIELVKEYAAVVVNCANAKNAIDHETARFCQKEGEEIMGGIKHLLSNLYWRKR